MPRGIWERLRRARREKNNRISAERDDRFFGNVQSRLRQRTLQCGANHEFPPAPSENERIGSARSLMVARNVRSIRPHDGPTKPQRCKTIATPQQNRHITSSRAPESPYNFSPGTENVIGKDDHIQ
eukprot:4804721-Pyramimonas_sp.AAC.1